MVATLLSAVSPTISGSIGESTGSYVIANYLWAAVAAAALVAGIVSVSCLSVRRPVYPSKD